jgi:hypothetical protein
MLSFIMTVFSFNRNEYDVARPYQSQFANDNDIDSLNESWHWFLAQARCPRIQPGTDSEFP